MKSFCVSCVVALLALCGVADAQVPGHDGLGVDTCSRAFNNICEDPDLGGPPLCAAGTDRADCRGRDRALSDPGTFFGRDDRVLMNTSVFPWTAIGELTFAGSQCSGSLIGPDIVLTAAHCVLGPDGLIDEGQFTTARARAGGPLSASIVDVRILETLVNEAELEGRFSQNVDWALVRLDRSIGNETGYLGVEVVRDNRPLRTDLVSAIAMVLITAIAAAATEGRTRLALAALAVLGGLALAIFAYRTVLGEDPRRERILQAGYSADTGIHLSGSSNCRVSEFLPSGIIGHTCDTVSGDSGSPLLARRGQDWVIIGVVSYSSTQWTSSFYGRGPRTRVTERAYAVSATQFPDPRQAFEP